MWNCVNIVLQGYIFSLNAIGCYVLEWIHKYTESFIQPETLQERVDAFMQEYDKRKEEVRPPQAVFSIIQSSSVCPKQL